MINDNLIAVPGFNSAEEPVLPQYPYGDFARTTSRPRIGASTREPHSPPTPVLSEVEKINPQETRSQDFFPPVPVPIGCRDPVQHTLQFIRYHLPLPRPRTVKHQRDCASVIGRFHGRAGERGVE